MALKLQVGHAQGVNGKYADGMKSGVKSANQRRKERIRNKKNKDGQQRATAPANLAGASSGILSAASSPEYRGAMTPSYQTSRRPMTPTYGGTASSKTPGYSDRTPGYSSRTPGYSTKSAKTPGY
ncbi:hypothetical protein QFC20_005503 [Naganishia adeliensis]|uniref:Uncharacterized protein n=1 Tax=Naganishia adeliensis TaxID=92952 RepID=A0ACC2VNL5_9TREE|nr:hypothetical protein QFC20_005503 [Naganishia adeliensis]